MTTSRPTMNYGLIKRATSWLDMDMLCILYQILFDTKEWYGGYPYISSYDFIY